MQAARSTVITGQVSQATLLKSGHQEDGFAGWMTQCCLILLCSTHPLMTVILVEAYRNISCIL